MLIGKGGCIASDLTMTMERKTFLNRYGISETDFKLTGLAWHQLLDIRNDYLARAEKMHVLATNVSTLLMKAKGVHSVKHRIKAPDNLIEKIIRKKQEKKKVNITCANYRKKVKDLVGVRVLHLFKEDWGTLHEYITNKFKIARKPLAYIREGDSRPVISNYRKKGCVVKEHPYGYRSVHYSVMHVYDGNPEFIELQVRTIFEEGWSEIDHLVRYCASDSNPFISPYLELFNRAAGYADEMGSFILQLKNITHKLNNKQKRSSEIIDSLRKEIGKLRISEEKKKDLKEQIQEITNSNTQAIPLPVLENQR